jgi:hypothetical protein
MITKRRGIAGLAVLAMGAAAGIGVALTRGHADSTVIPPDAVTKLAEQHISVVLQQPPPANPVSADSVEKTLGGEGPMTVNGAYIVKMIDSASNKSCTCWLILYTPDTPYVSEAGLTANFYSAFFDAQTGAYVEGLNGKLP